MIYEGFHTHLFLDHLFRRSISFNGFLFRNPYFIQLVVMNLTFAYKRLGWATRQSVYSHIYSTIDDLQWKVKRRRIFKFDFTIYFVQFQFAAVILLTLLVCIVAIGAQKHNTHNAIYTHGNGRPACNRPEEMNRKWRNNWDPLRYWVCHGNRAVSYVCPTEYLYFDNSQCCIHWAYWYHLRPYDPPSQA